MVSKPGCGQECDPRLDARDYAEVVGRDAVVASTDCGLGGRGHPQIAWAKLEALAQGAELATKRLWK